jgi:hypothetical protein
VKLLGGSPYDPHKSLSDNQQLACLAQRIPIEFLSALYVSRISDPEKKQVNSHMRVILKIDNSLETMATTSPSEPVLSEAAYHIMSTSASFNSPQVLQIILDGLAVDKGKLGELIVALLFVENPGISYSELHFLIPDSRAVFDLIFTLSHITHH